METDKILLGDAVERLNGIDRKGQLSLDTDYDEVKKQLVSER